MRHRPVLVTGSPLLPVTVAEVKEWLRIATADDDAQLERDIRAAAAHYEGWTGVLGIVLCEQTWRQDYDDWGSCYQGPNRVLYLPLKPVIGVDSVKVHASDGTLSTVAAASYALRTDAGGRSFVAFDRDYSFPSGLSESAAIAVEFKAGWADIPASGSNPARSGVPDDIKRAIALRVQLLHDEAADTNSQQLERVERALIEKYRRPF